MVKCACGTEFEVGYSDDVWADPIYHYGGQVVVQCPSCGDLLSPEGLVAGRLASLDEELFEAARALLAKLDCITTDEFMNGGEKSEREYLRAVIGRILGTPAGECKGKL